MPFCKKKKKKKKNEKCFFDVSVSFHLEQG